MIDFRSDTVTKASPEMLKAMASAKVGDDVFEDDPSVNYLEAQAARLFGMEAALFCPSGTMTNQIAIKCHTQAGDEVICDRLSHVYNYEGGGIAFNSGASVRLLNGDRGRFKLDELKNAINPDDVHFPISRLVSLENTSNKGGGAIYNFDDILEISEFCRSKNLGIHLDGARLFNALVETKEKAEDFGKAFDSISICLSKGLGCPVGSLLLGNSEFIKKARRVRKIFGGGMRQAGHLAAAGSYALEHHIERLKEDHEKAQELGEALKQKEFVERLLDIETNILVFELSKNVNPQEFIQKMLDKGVRVVSFGGQLIRIVCHLDITKEMITSFKKILKEI